MKAYMSEKARKDMKNPKLARALVKASLEASIKEKPYVFNFEGITYSVSQVSFKT